MLSRAEIEADLPEKKFEALVRKTGEKFWEERDFNWNYYQRPEQAAPQGDWQTWAIIAGRGFGKTRAGAEWVREQALSHPGSRFALVAATLDEARRIMVEGESGLLSIGHPDERPEFDSSIRRVRWDNGSIATLYSAGEPDSLRGPEHHFAWCDEVAKWDRAERSWDMLGMTMRLGDLPRVVATTTPRPIPLVRRLIGDASVIKTFGRTSDNRRNLAQPWLAAMNRIHGGTRLGRQELDGELIDDVPGALWSRELIDRCRGEAPAERRRVVIGVDPSASSGLSSGGLAGSGRADACGIVVCAKGPDGRAWVLADCTVEGASPERWARAVANAAEAWRADRVVAEGNQGGAMVETVLRGADVTLPVKRVHARVGKSARAEPVAALFESGQAKFGDAFPELEDQLCGMITGGGYEGPGRSPDRADACVWALTELMLDGKGKAEPRVRVLGW